MKEISNEKGQQHEHASYDFVHRLPVERTARRRRCRRLRASGPREPRREEEGCEEEQQSRSFRRLHDLFFFESLNRSLLVPKERGSERTMEKRERENFYYLWALVYRL